MYRIEQSAKLNKYVDPTIPITWASRWSSVKLALPLILLCSFLLIEMAALRWFMGKPVRMGFAIVAACLLPFVLIIAAEIQLRIQQRMRRVLKIDSKGVSTSIKGSWVKWAWPYIEAFEICPIEGGPSLRRLVVHFSRRSPKRVHRTQRVLVLPNAKAEEDLRIFLRHKTDFEGAVYEVRDGCATPEPKRRPRPAAIISLTLSMLLFIHGVPLTMVGLKPNPPPVSSEQVQPHDPTPLEKTMERIIPWAKRNFKNGNELAKTVRIAFLVLGITCTAASVILWIIGTSVPQESSSICQASQNKRTVR